MNRRVFLAALAAIPAAGCKKIQNRKNFYTDVSRHGGWAYPGDVVTLRAGDVFTISGHYVDGRGGALQRFMVTHGD